MSWHCIWIWVHAHLCTHASMLTQLYTSFFGDLFFSLSFLFSSYIDWDSAEQCACAGRVIPTSRWCSSDTSPCCPTAESIYGFEGRVWQSHYLFVFLLSMTCLITTVWWDFTVQVDGVDNGGQTLDVRTTDEVLTRSCLAKLFFAELKNLWLWKKKNNCDGAHPFESCQHATLPIKILPQNSFSKYTHVWWMMSTVGTKDGLTVSNHLQE